MSTNEKNRISVDVIIPTYQPGAEFAKLLRSLALQVLLPDNIFIVNTEEKYWDERFTADMPNCTVMHISKEEFNHGASRHMAAMRSQADILVFMTQDAMPADKYLLKELTAPIMEKKAVVSYARQLPREHATLLESYTRNFNYPPESMIKSKNDLGRLGIKTYFCSNVCAAYDHRVYDEMGGFPRPVILNEDMIMAANVIQAGYNVACEAKAKVIHSHSYGARKQFSRNFDIGVSQAMCPEIFDACPSVGEGTKLVKQSAKYVCKKRKYYLLFSLVWQSGWKFLGYSMGKRYKKLPEGLVKKWSDSPGFWNLKGEK